MNHAARARLEALLESARGLADPHSERGRNARERLCRASGLSPEGVDFAFERCLEITPNDAEISALLAAAPPAPRAHVLLSAQVFVAAHRAIALGLAASAEVSVRPSRREPEMAELLSAGAPELFQIVRELAPEPGDHLWAYGSDDTLREVARALPDGVALHAHGTGFGIGVIGATQNRALERVLTALAEDVALFDQRGCLSPRLLFVLGSRTHAVEIASELARALTALERRVPRGRMSPEELAEISVYRDSASYAGELFSAGHGFVSVSERSALPPVGRNLHVVSVSNPVEALGAGARFVTTYALAQVADELRAELTRALPGARATVFGRMQAPPFDGPVDRRARSR